MPQISKLLHGLYDNEIEEFINRNSNYLAHKTLTAIKSLDEKGYKIINSKYHYILELFYQKQLKLYIYKNSKDLYYKSNISDNFHFQIRENFMIKEINKHIYSYKNPLLIISYSHLLQ